jgi:HEPN domain-containing protein
MTTEEKVEYWVEIADEDLTVAETMLKNQHNMYAGFMCHLVIEKVFKAAYQKIKNETPPYTHSLPRLAELAGFFELLSEEQISFIDELNPLNIEARYTNYKKEVAKKMTNERTRQVFEQTKLLQQWIKERILSK